MKQYIVDNNLMEEVDRYYIAGYSMEQAIELTYDMHTMSWSELMNKWFRR